jgi:hypothetical protein
MIFSPFSFDKNLKGRVVETLRVIKTFEVACNVISPFSFDKDLKGRVV